MWYKYWCSVFVSVAIVGLAISDEPSTEEEDYSSEDDNDGPTTPRPPPPVALANMTDLVKGYGYEIEEFEIKAPDGQKLSIFHLKPKKSGGPVVLLQHGGGMSPDLFCFQPDSLGFLLVEKGADVWMPSGRGGVFSRKHEKYDPNNDIEFWDFSIIEMAEQDLPAAIDFILEKTKQPSLYFIGHSLATSVFLVALSKKPEYNAKIKEATLLAPIWYCAKYQFMINKQSSMYQMVLDTYKQWDDNQKWEAFPRKDVMPTKHQLSCNDLPEMATPYCEMGMDMLYSSIGEFMPAGTSVKLMKHMVGTYLVGKIKPWDYEDAALNRKAYNQDTPPDYDVTKVTTKVNLFWAPADQAIDIEDVKKLKNDLPNVGIAEGAANEAFNHPDFILPSTPAIKSATHDFHLKLIDMVK